MTERPGDRTLLERLCRAALRLFPPEFRRRHAPEIIRTLRELRRGDDRRWSRRARLLAYLWDALATLPRAWAHELRQIAPREALARAARPTAIHHHIAQAIKSLRRSPRYTIVVLGTLALALGANAAIFSVTYAVLLRSLPYDAPERIVRVGPAPIGGRGPMGPGIHPDFLASPAVESAALVIANGGANLVEAKSASRVSLVQVEPAFFDVLGVEMAIGTSMTEGPDASREAVLGHGLWSRAFGSDPHVVGRSIALNGHGYRVVGVAPPDMGYPAGTALWLSPPLEESLYHRPTGPMAVARLMPGARRESLYSILEERRDHLYARAPEELVRPPIEVEPILDELSGPVRVPLLVLTAAAGVLLLLGCLNLASLALSRVTDRLDDLRTRHALGASRMRVFGELIAESFVLAAAGGVVGILVARTGARLLGRWLPPDVPGIDAVAVSGPVLGFTLVATAMSAVLAGAVPSLWGASIGSERSLGRQLGQGTVASRLQTRLLSGQAALAVVLGVAAGLLGQSLQAFASVPLGYDTVGVLGFQVELSMDTDERAWRRYIADVTQRIEALEGVAAVGATSRLPFTPGFAAGTVLRARPDGQPVEAAVVHVSPGYLRTLDIPVLGGRLFSATDSPAGTDDVILSRSLARSLFGDGSAVGESVWLLDEAGERQDRLVRAVVGDARLRGRYESGVGAIVYADLRSAPVRAPGFAVRTRAAGPLVEEGVRGVLTSVDRAVAPFRFEMIANAASQEVAGRRAAASLAALFGFAALVLVAVGIYGVLGHWVVRKRQEIGLRVALGARANRLALRVLWRGLRPILSGMIAGLVIAAMGSRYLSSLLYEIPPWDPLTYTAVAVTIVSVALLSAWRPAIRAARVEAAKSLRGE